MKTPPVTIVVPVYRHAGTLAACLRSVVEHTDYPDWKLIVVDDGCGENFSAVLPKIRNIALIRQANGGVAKALNAGFAAAAGRDVVRLHADVVIETPGWLGRLVAAAYEQPRTAAVGVRLVYPDGRIQSEGRSIVNGLGFHLQHANRKGFVPESAAGKRAEVDSVAGGLAYYRREALEEIGGLDENYGPAWFEDDDFCFGARRLNYRIFVEPAVRAVHFARSASPTFSAPRSAGDGVLGPLVHGFKQTGLKLQAKRWEAKWGWNPYYPDVNEIRRLYGDTEVCWQIGECLRFKPSSPTPTVDCCIVTWNSVALLRRTLESLAAVDYPAELIRVFVANNGSTDGTAEYLAGLVGTYPFPVTAIDLPLNTGVAPGLNLAIMAGQGELVARLDDDIVLPREWIARMLQDLKSRPFAGNVGLKTVGDDDRRAIQWGATVAYPKTYCYGEESDVGQSSALVRVSHVAGCCNLYRRDAIKRCGLVDIRYNPTQWDDIDHCLMLIQAGYEVLYEGQLHVLHKRSSGIDRSIAAQTNVAAGSKKLHGKWGEDILQVVENALLFSREGRCLPADGDTSEWLSRGSVPAEFPRLVPSLEADSGRFLLRVYESQAAAVPPGSELHALVEQYLARARALHSEGECRLWGETLLTVVNFAPTRLEGYRALAAHYRYLGQTGLARDAARRGLHLSPTDSALLEVAGTTGESIGVQEKLKVALSQGANPSPEPSWSTARSLRVLLVSTYQPRGRNDDLLYLAEYCRQLNAGGIYAEISAFQQPTARGFDVVHFWDSEYPYQTLAQMKAVRVLHPDIPLVLSPRYRDLATALWNGKILTSVFGRPSRAHWETGLTEFAAGKLTWSKESKPDRNPFVIQASELGVVQRHLFQFADHLLPFTVREGDEVARDYGVSLPTTDLPLGADYSELRAATAELFVKQYGVRDFVLMVGTMEATANQLLVLSALQSGNIPVVVIGPQIDPGYAALCQKMAPRNSLFLDRLPPKAMASAYRAARVFVAAGWAEAGCAPAYEAAFAGCSLALSNQLNERAEFEGHANFFDPSNLPGLRAAVQTAWTSHPARAAQRTASAEALAVKHDWSAVIPRSAAVYESLLAQA